MTEQDKMQYITYMSLKNELDNAALGGISLSLDGKKANAHDIASVCVFNEGCEYMRDYKRDEAGKLAELNFELVL